MAIGSGLAAQVGFGAESVFGTAVTVDHFFEHDEANLDLQQKWAMGQGLHAGGQVQRATRMVPTTRAAKGVFKTDVTTKKFGLLIRHMLGSPLATPVLISGAAFKQVHTLSNAAGLSLTTQIGYPRVDGVVEPFTYPGCKVSDWELSCQEGDLLKLNVGLDAQDELTTATTPAGAALTAASYPVPAEVFNFTQAVVKIGGTATTATGIASIASGVAVASLLRSLNVKQTNPLAESRFGTAAVKREQIANGYAAPTVSFDCEFQARTEFYDVFRAGTVLPMQITFTGTQIGVTGSFNSVDIVIPATKLIDDNISGNGMDLTNQPLNFQVLDDTANNPLQITYISTDTVL